jgi:NADH-quinone oxidoreductase subunit L
VQNDIKRVVAYSTLSQLGYMTVALGASAYSVAVFHLMTHAFFKALLFLAAGSVIMGMHHNQDMRYMGGARKYMKITWITCLLGSLALIGTPGFSGFFSKDSIIEAVHFSKLPGSGFAYFAVMAGVFVTAFYSFRMYFLTFHGKERYDDAHKAHHHDDHHDDHEHHGLAKGEKPHESPWVVTLPLILLAVPSVIIGWIAIEPMLFGKFFSNVITVAPQHEAMAKLGAMFAKGKEMGMMTHALSVLPLYLAAGGVGLAYYLYMVKPEMPAKIARTFSAVHKTLENKYGFDTFNEKFFAGGSRLLGQGLWKVGDQGLIDGLLVNGSARVIGGLAGLVRFVQNGIVSHYAFFMILGVFGFLTYFYITRLQ